MADDLVSQPEALDGVVSEDDNFRIVHLFIFILRYVKLHKFLLILRVAVVEGIVDLSYLWPDGDACMHGPKSSRIGNISNLVDQEVCALALLLHLRLLVIEPLLVYIRYTEGLKLYLFVQFIGKRTCTSIYKCI